ncbi:MAG: TetR/AcrR family transcriptional regulator [Actinomycetes bacterium]
MTATQDTPPPDTSRQGDEGTRSQRKRKAIMDAARTAFLAQGYRGTSMDDVAARASVSKQTVYKHFADKAELFTEIVTTTVNEVSDPVHAEVVDLQDSGDIESDLRDLARRQLTMVMQPRIMQLRRLVIAEASRFPELGRTFYERGPGRTIAALASSFERLAARGLLELDDPMHAATQFNWLVMSAPLNQAMLLGQDEPPSAAEVDGFVNGGVRTFLAAYEKRGSSSGSRSDR